MRFEEYIFGIPLFLHLYLRRLHLQEHHDLTVIGYGDIFPGRSEVSLPFGLQRLTFVAYYAQSTEKVSLPPGPQSSAFNAYFDQSTEKVSLPFGFQRLTLVAYYAQSTEKVNLPIDLQ